jgi:hypothetical protein
MSESHKLQPGLFGFFVGSGQRGSRYPVPGIDGAGVNDLISNKLDFVGISAYAPYRWVYCVCCCVAGAGALEAGMLRSEDTC